MADTLDPATLLQGTLTLGNLKYTYTTPSADGGAFGTSGSAKSSGKWYMEVQLTNKASGGDSGIGFGISGTATLSQLGSGGGVNGILAYESNAIWKGGGSVGTVPGRASASGDWYGLLLDLTGNLFQIQNITSGGGLSTAIAIPAGTYLPAVVANATNDAWTVNFGSTAFQQAVPSGFSRYDALAGGFPYKQTRVIA